MRSRSSRGRRSSINSPVNEASVTVARSEPEPFTHRIRAGRPRKSTSSALAEVLPPPQLQTVRSAPSLRDRATSCASVVDTDTLVIVYILLASKGNYAMKKKATSVDLCAGIAAGRGDGNPLACYTISISAVAQCRDGIGVQPLTGAHLSQQRTYIGLVGRLQHAIAFQHIARFLGAAQCHAIHQQGFGVGCLDVEHALNHRFDLGFDIV